MSADLLDNEQIINILIADDHFITRTGLVQVLQNEWASASIEEVADTQSLLQKVTLSKWDIIICDINMPDGNGLDALKQIRTIAPRLPVLILSMYPAEQYAIKALKTGASGFLTKIATGTELVGAVKKLLSGKKYFSETVIELLAESIGRQFDKLPHEGLSNREFDVMKLIVSGKSLVTISEKLSLSIYTVNTYRSRLMKKIGIKSNIELVKYAVENKLLEY